jgi:hypothetical protein
VRFQVNLTVQILLKQGQVELENFQLMLEYSDAILINKNIIEDLNSVIRVIIVLERTAFCIKCLIVSLVSVVSIPVILCQFNTGWSHWREGAPTEKMSS